MIESPPAAEPWFEDETAYAPVTHRRPAPLSRAGLASLAMVFVVSLTLDVRTLLPDVGFWDTGEFQTVGPILGIAHPTGFPTYTLLSWLASIVFTPFGNPAFRVDLLSAVLASGASALTGLAVLLVTGRGVLALAAGLLLAVSPLTWEIGQAADPHALHLFFAALLLVLLLAWQRAQRHDPDRAGRWLFLAAITFALALGNHALTLLLVPGIAAFALLVEPQLLFRRWRLTLACAIGLVATTVGVYAYLPLRASMNPPLNYADPVTWSQFTYLVLGEQFRGTFHALPSLAGGLSTIWSELRQNLGLGAILAGAGAILGFARNGAFAMMTLLWFAFTFLFALGYVNAAIERYYLVPILVAVVWAAVAVDVVWRSLARAAAAWRPDPLLGAALTAALAAILIVPTLAPVPRRLESLDRSNDTAARQWLNATFMHLEANAVIISWWTYSTPLWYGRWVEGSRPDITIIDDRTIIDDGYDTAENAIDTYLGQRPVYLIRLERDLPAFEERYSLQAVAGIPGYASGVVYRVQPKVTA